MVQSHGISTASAARPQTQGIQNDIDIFEDDDDDYAQPGPGAYYNPKNQTSFKTGKIPERLQFFGSTVERFGENKSNVHETQTVGPGTYSINNLINYHKKSNPAIYSGFTSTEQRFTYNNYKMLTPGPGQYQARTIASEMQQRVTSKSGVFGST